MKPIIFLDIDGVLNHDQFRSFRGFEAISNNCVCALVHILREADAQIVISSSWRTDHLTLDSFNDHFRQCALSTGVNAALIDEVIKRTIDMTLDFDFSNRGGEIAEWIESNGFTGSFAILDDEHDIISGELAHENPKDMTEHLFECSDDGCALTWEIAERVIKHLKGN